jgi:hypothetical protein
VARLVGSVARISMARGDVERGVPIGLDGPSNGIRQVPDWPLGAASQHRYHDGRPSLDHPNILDSEREGEFTGPWICLGGSGVQGAGLK